MSTPAVLHAEGLSFHHPERELFADWSTSILPGVTLVRGGDGRGKTTLLRLLAGRLPADAGQLQVNDVRLADQPVAYRQQVFWAEPRSEAFDQMTPVEYFESQRGRYPGFHDEVLGDLVDGLALEPHMNKQLHMLSAGSKRKVWLAAAFASGAAVTLLDEPFAALDKASIGFVVELLEDAADHPERAWVIADYEAPGDVRLASVIDLGD
ncbi:ATP-binding cassette domain-containing protein [Polaromonas sp. P2-4]|nr:ATP-binding cassette domain-containing protein [Polaromonas sp. P2-4]